MWQRFTERARRVVFFAQEEAGRLGENYVGSEHLLLGLIRDEDGVAARILVRMDVSLESVRSEVERLATRGDGRLGQDMQLTPRAKRVIDLAYDEARQLTNNYIGTEHLLLGLIREAEGLAARVLERLGVELERTREELRKLQDKDSGLPAADRTAAAPSAQSTGAPGAGDARGYREVINAAQAAEGAVRMYGRHWRGRSLLTLTDVTSDQINGVLVTASALKQLRDARSPIGNPRCVRTLAMLFEKPSLRTRVSFEAGMAHLGGHAIYLAPADVGLGTREAVPDVAAALSRWVDCIAARVFRHETVVQLAEAASVPVINALSDLEHPCQAFADLATIQQHKQSLGPSIKIAYLGDGNNVLHSLMMACMVTGMRLTAACPEGYGPLPDYVERAQAAGSTFSLLTDPIEAVADADVVYTDVWTSMGQEDEREQRLEVFRPYQVNAELLGHAKPDVIVLHCLPAHRGEEITNDVMKAHAAAILDQAENRMHTQKALIALILGVDRSRV